MSRHTKKSKHFSLFTLLIACFLAVFYFFTHQSNIVEEFKPVSVTNSIVSGLHKVVKVIDGDTIRLDNGETVRYLGVDTPETKIKRGSKFIYKPQPYALEALEFNRRFTEGKMVRLEYDLEHRDKYKRILAHCFVDGRHINAQLVANGYACVFTIPPNLKYYQDFVILQRSAQVNNLGMWGACEPISAKQAKNCVNQIRRVRGVVSSVDSSRSNMVCLNLGDKDSRDFIVVIYRKDLIYFKNKNIDVENFYNKRNIEVSGKIRYYIAPEIIVSMPDDIIVLE